MKNLLATITLSLGALAAFAQEPLDGAYQKVVTKEKEVIPYDFIREADVFWSKRIWRSIDVREKMNLPFTITALLMEINSNKYCLLKM